MGGKPTQGPMVFEFVPDGDGERNLPKAEWTGFYIGPEDDERPGQISHTILEGGLVHGPVDGDPEVDLARFCAGFNACQQVEAAGYDGLEAVKALPELLKALRIALALPAQTSDGTFVPIGSKVECLQEGSALLDRLTKKDTPDDAA